MQYLKKGKKIVFLAELFIFSINTITVVIKETHSLVVTKYDKTPTQTPKFVPFGHFSKVFAKLFLDCKYISVEANETVSSSITSP